MITAGLDKRVTACVANHPALSDMAGYKAGPITGYSGLTPMINSASFQGGVDSRNIYPINRTYTIQLILSF